MEVVNFFPASFEARMSFKVSFNSESVGETLEGNAIFIEEIIFEGIDGL